MWRRSTLFFLFILINFFTCAQSWKTVYDSASLSWEDEQWAIVLSQLTRAEKLAQNDLGIYDPSYLAILNDLGLVYMNLGQYELADQFLHQAISLRDEIHLNTDEEYRTVSQNYARLLSFRDSEKALLFTHQLLDKFPEESVSLALLLGDIHEMAGQLDSATFYYFHGNTDRQKTTYQQQIKQIQGLRIAGDLDGAEKLTNIYLKVLSDKRDSLSQEFQIQKSKLMVEKGMVYVETANYIDAEILLKNALTLSKDNTLTLNVWNGLAILYARMGLQEKSLDLLNMALEKGSPSLAQRSQLLQYKAAILESQGHYDSAWLIYKKQLKLSHPPIQHVNLLLQAARTLESRDKLKEADSLLQQAQQLSRQYNMSPPIRANLLVQQGYGELRKAHFEAADTLLSEALQIKTDLLGDQSVQLNEIKGNLALARLARGDRENALQLLSENIAGIQRQIKYTFPILSRKEKINTYSLLEKNFDRFNSLVMALAPNDPDLVRIMFNKQMLLKGLMLRTADRFGKENCTGSDTSELLKELHQSRVKLASLYNRIYSHDLHKLEIKRLEDHINRLESSISASCPGTSPLSSTDNITWETISNHLKPNEALVEIIRVPEFATDSGEKKRYRIGFTGDFYYVALIIKQGKSPVLISLPDGKAMENRFYSYYSNAIFFDITDTLSYNRYWKPIGETLKGKSKIFLVNDGVYHKINVNNILDPNTNNFLISTLNIQLLVNPANILHTETRTAVINSALLMGDPQPATISNGQESYFLKALPGTKREIQNIQQQLDGLSIPTSTFLNHQATITNFNANSGASIVHIASHGFFSPDLIPAQSAVADAGLLASGLIFTRDSIADTNVLTAYEIQGIDFSQAELVVLSACESGLGEIRNGEGIDGLQRAFLASGARTLLLSLWRVDDASTEHLMTTFYRYYLKNFKSREALRRAQMDMIAEGFPSQSWSAFIVSGD